tara:strand:+ start:3904 stop:4266 length:363 start_codon:yes stop_codon:yes gene_type:complete
MTKDFTNTPCNILLSSNKEEFSLLGNVDGGGIVSIQVGWTEIWKGKCSKTRKTPSFFLEFNSLKNAYAFSIRLAFGHCYSGDSDKDFSDFPIPSGSCLMDDKRFDFIRVLSVTIEVNLDK